MRIAVSRNWVWNRKTALLYWVALFIAFGPLMLLTHSNQYVGSVIFSDNPFAYFMSNGLGVATLAVGFMYLIDRFVKWRRSRTLL